jgi:hypothetical protein
VETVFLAQWKIISTIQETRWLPTPRPLETSFWLVHYPSKIQVVALLPSSNWQFFERLPGLEAALLT